MYENLLWDIRMFLARYGTSRAPETSQASRSLKRGDRNPSSPTSMGAATPEEGREESGVKAKGVRTSHTFPGMPSVQGGSPGPLLCLRQSQNVLCLFLS